MKLGKRRRIILLVLGLTSALLLALVLSLPLWFPWLLGPLVRAQGANYARYQRLGYDRFSLHSLTYTNQSIQFSAERADVLVPSVWLWRAAVTREARPQPFLRVDGWQLVIRGNERPSSPAKQKPPPSVYTNFTQVEAILAKLQCWLPAAVLSNGTLRLKPAVVTLPVITWSNGTLWAETALAQKEQAATLNLTRSAGHDYKLNFKSDLLHLESSIQLVKDDTLLHLRSTNWWWTNRLELQGDFSPVGMLPMRATLEAPAFRFPARQLGFTNYEDLTGTLSGGWDGEHFAVNLEAEARPNPSETNLPPIRAIVQAQGDTNSANISSLRLSAPWLKAELSRDCQIHFTGPLLRQPVSFKIAADLAGQNWFPLQGKVNGEADFKPGETKFPLVHFHFTGAGIGKDRLIARTVAAGGALEWPWLELTELKGDFDDGSLFSAAGRVDFQNKTLADAHLEFKGPLAQQWLPRGYNLDNLSLTATVVGPLQRLTHNGKLEISQLTSPMLRPVQLHAEWSGEQLNLHRAAIELSASNSTLALQAQTELSATTTNFILHQLTLATNQQPILALGEPWRVSLAPTETPKRWRVIGGPFSWSGAAGRLEFEAGAEWPRQAAVRIRAEQLHPETFSDFWQGDLPKVEISKLVAQGGWTNGPATFQLEVAVRTSLVKDFPLAAELALGADSSGVVISNLAVSSQTSVVAKATGMLPIILNPGGITNRVWLDSRKPLQLHIATQPEAVVWDKLAQVTGLVLHQPDLKVDVAGTWERPKGGVELRAQEVQFAKTDKKLPSLEKLRVILELEPERARLTDARVWLQGQPLVLTAEMPLGQAFWTALKKKQIPDWSQARAQLHAEEVELAAFAELIPNILSPQGQATIDLALVPGGNWEGDIAVQRARTRPLPTVGPLRNVSLNLKVHQRALTLEKASADIGGSVVQLAGDANLAGTNWLNEGLPPFRLAVTGTNVPLSRQAESIIRSDLNLVLLKTNGAALLVSGTAHLRHSYYFSDLGSLVPGKVATPSTRPPYFSIEKLPWADCRLMVHVTGERFLNVRSPVFVGDVSANLNLHGTLKEPIALGQVQIDSGVVRFPFANLRVEQGFVSLTSENPYRPQLAVSAGSKQFGYEVRMDVSGPADAPIIQFSSTPPLSSEEIVLMVTAGQMPRGAFALTPKQRAQTVAMFLGRDLLSKFGSGTETEQRLTIRSGEEISEQGKPTYNVEYKVTDRWSLVGEYDRFGDFNAGLKWRVYSK